MTGSAARPGPDLVVGLGVTGRAVAAALTRRGRDVVVVDDRPTEATRAAAADLGVELVEAPDGDALEALVARAARLLPSPGVPDRHPAFVAARAHGTPVRSEFDLAGEWDDRPVLAVTGTDGKTTVTTVMADALARDGRRVALAGNTDVPLVAAIDDPRVELFVVEASSFRLGHSHRFAPRVATWLNLSPDHLDVHADLDAYVAAKARIFADQGPDDTAVVNADDPVVRRHGGAARRVTFSLVDGDVTVRDGLLVAGDEALLAVDELWRRFPHDVANALAAWASLRPVGASTAAVADALREFPGLPHRVQPVGERDGVRFYDDSKATVPHAVVAAVSGFDSVVLIAGGRNKGIDLSPLASVASHLRAAVAIGEAAPDVAAVLGGVGVDVAVAATMADAVALAADRARPGDAVLLSPGCASFDWYGSYGERGDDFAAAVRRLLGEVPA